jgi:hypothetical protein
LRMLGAVPCGFFCSRCHVVDGLIRLVR